MENQCSILIIAAFLNTEQIKFNKFFGCLANLDYDNYHVLMVDDGSDYNHLSLAKRNVEGSDNISLYSHENYGQPLARLDAILKYKDYVEDFTPDYIILLDTDDEFSSDLLAVVNKNRMLYDNPDLIQWDTINDANNFKDTLGYMFLDSRNIKMSGIKYGHLFTELHTPGYLWLKAVKTSIYEDVARYLIKTISDLKLDTKSLFHLDDVAVTLALCMHINDAVITDDKLYNYIAPSNNKSPEGVETSDVQIKMFRKDGIPTLCKRIMLDHVDCRSLNMRRVLDWYDIYPRVCLIPRRLYTSELVNAIIDQIGIEGIEYYSNSQYVNGKPLFEGYPIIEDVIKSRKESLDQPVF